jgi:thymidylate kinase
MRTSRLEGHVSTAESKPEEPKTKGISGLIYALRSVALAWDRSHLLRKNRRYAANGEMIICDRYPSEIIGAMDSPRLTKLSGSSGISALLYNWLAGLERKFYRQIAQPDMVLQLRVSVETAIQRNRDRIKVGKETDVYLASRHSHNKDWQRAGTRCIHNIDTEQSLEDTILSVKKAIWESL